MELAEVARLLTPDALNVIDEIGPIASSDDAAEVVHRLRKTLDPDLVAITVTQARLRTRAQAKFGDFASRMLFTAAGLEQATRLELAAVHAQRFRRAGLTHVADLGCGIGGDAMGLAALGMRVRAVDADEVTAALAAFNLAPFGEDVEVVHGSAESASLSDVDGVWLDPARRTAGHGETTRVGPHAYSPSLDWAYDLSRRVPTGIKLGPGLDRDLLPEHGEAQWISVDGSTVELVLWSGVLARPGVARSALVIRNGHAQELTAPHDSDDEPVRALGEFLHEPDGAVIRARLIGEVARSLRAGPIAPQIAYLSSDDALASPFVQSFRVRETLPTDVKRLAKALRDRGIGTLEIKKRGMDIDPATLRKKLRLSGPEHATLVLTRLGSRRVALLADRV